MNGRSAKSSQPTLWDFDTPTFSPASADGLPPCNSQAGPPTSALSPEARPANRSRPRASRKARPTSDTSGPSISESFGMSDLYSRLVSRLKQRFGTVGSMEFKQTWKVRVTPSGLSYWAHTAVGHRTSASASSSSPSETTPPPSSPPEDTMLAGCSTPRASDGPNGGPNQTGGSLPADAALAAWRTPMANEKVRSEEFADGRTSLSPMEALAGWATPDANSGDGGLQADPEAALERLKSGRSNLDDMAHMAGWATPTVGDSKNARNETAVRHKIPPTGIHPGQTLVDQVTGLTEPTTGWPTPMAGSPGTEEYNPAGNTDSSRRTVELVEVPTVLPWATPSARDFKSESATDEFNAERDAHPRGKPLSYQVTKTSGPPATSSAAGTTSGGGSPRGVLNPYFSAWLQGYSTEWVEAGLRAAATVKSRSRSRSRKSKAAGQS